MPPGQVDRQADRLRDAVACRALRGKKKARPSALEGTEQCLAMLIAGSRGCDAAGIPATLRSSFLRARGWLFPCSGFLRGIQALLFKTTFPRGEVFHLL